MLNNHRLLFVLTSASSKKQKWIFAQLRSLLLCLLCVLAHIYRSLVAMPFVHFRNSETFGGLSGMLRQILSPSPETGDMNNLANCCNMILQPSVFNSHASVLASTLQMTTPVSHHSAMTPIEQPNYYDHVQILTETHPCPSCGMKLTYHVRTTHPRRDQVDQLLDVNETQLMRFTCHACSRTFLAQSHLRMHEVIHASPRVSSTVPTSASSSQYPTTNSQVLVNQDKNFSCDRCQATFRYRTLLERHKKMHDAATGQDKPYSCPRCLMRFETRNLYNHHAKTHKPLVSPAERTASSNVLPTSGTKDMIHTGTNSGVLYNKSNNSFPCEVCAKEFPSMESLTSHKAVHRNRPLICDVCGKGFTHRKYYVVHQRIHTGERPYLCAMCGKSFTQASTLTVHRRYHTGERPYTCTLCGKGFVTRTIMLNHMKKH